MRVIEVGNLEEKTFTCKECKAVIGYFPADIEHDEKIIQNLDWTTTLRARDSVLCPSCGRRNAVKLSETLIKDAPEMYNETLEAET